MSTFRLLSYSKDGRATGAVAIGNQAYDLADARPATPTVLSVMEDWAAASADLRALAADPTRVAALKGRPLESLTYLAPVLFPNGIYCAGANYHDHMAEMAKAFNLPPAPDPHEVGMPPWFFIKTPRNTLAGHGATVKLPPFSKTVDWEIEVALVIGRTAKDVSIEQAMDYVACYSIANDLSARDHLRRTGVKPNSGSPMEYDWVSHKNWDGSCPMGPWLVPREDMPDTNNLGLKLWVNDTLMQDSSTKQIIFNDAELVAFMSQRVTLYPGDIIITGTPAGVGTPRGIFLKSGDVVRCEVQGVGTLVNTMA
jgi:2-keto-4-pentenoate hydratase/2-oxohepta-3-ene-1,7-dioic acid hydratase in catechol pathway